MISLWLAFAPVWAQDAPEEPATDDEASAEGDEELPPILVMPTLVEFVQAPFPEAALEAEIEGIVLLLIEIDETGAVTSVEVLEAAGWGFDEAAHEAASQFVFTPAEDETGPVPVMIEFEYGFVLDAAQVEGAVPDEEVAETLEEAPLPVNLEGFLIEMGSRAVVAGQVVTLADSEVTAETDAAGHFEFRGVPVGPLTLRVVSADHQVLEKSLEVTEGEVTEVRLWIKPTGYEEEAVGTYRRPGEDITRRTLTISEIRRVPGTFGDPVRVIQNLPGAARSPFGTGLLIIRGSNPEDSAVYVDGIRIPIIYHLGGYASIFNSDLVETVDYLPGGYGVQYGRSLGGVVDVTTKSETSEQTRLTWSTDIMDSGGMVEGRFGKDKQHHYAVAARRSYIDLFVPFFIPDELGIVVKPRWLDYQAKYAYTGMENTRFTALLFGFEDQLLVTTPEDMAQGTDQDAQGDVAVRYSTHRILFQVDHRFSDKLTGVLTPSFGADFTHFGLGEELKYDSWQVLLTARGELRWTPFEALEVIPGFDLIGGYYDFKFEMPFNPDMLSDYDPLGERERTVVAGDDQAWGPDFYLKTVIRPFEENRERLILTPGLRLNATWLKDLYAITSVDARLAFRAQILEHGFVKGGTGTYQQPPQPMESYHPELPVELGYERAWATSLGWEQELPQGFRFDFETFYKLLDRQIVYNPDFEDFYKDQYFVNEGIGRAYGLEVIAQRDPIGRFFGWISYTLSRSVRNNYPDDDERDDLFPETDDTGWYLYDYDQTHILVAIAGYTLPFEVMVSGRFRYVSGNPTNPYEGGVYDLDQDFYYGYRTDEYNTHRLPPFVGLDLRIERDWQFKRARLNTYVDFLNVYRGENPEFEQNNFDYTESRYIRGLPFIPSPGFELEVLL